MARYILGRIGGLLVALLFVSIITFTLMHAVPGGPLDEEKQPLLPAAKANKGPKCEPDRVGVTTWHCRGSETST